MLTLNVEYEVLQDRLMTVKLPGTVSPGRHSMVIVLDEASSQPEGSVNDFQKQGELIKKRYALSMSESVIDAEEIFRKMSERHAG